MWWLVVRLKLVTNEGVDVSRTEQLLETLAQALEARARVEALKLRYAKMDPTAMGEQPLEVAIIPVQEYYVKKLDALRALLTVSGLSI